MDPREVLHTVAGLCRVTGFAEDHAELLDSSHLEIADIADLLESIAREISPARDHQSRIVALHSEDLCDPEIARRLGVAPGTVRRIRRALGLPGNPAALSTGWEALLTSDHMDRLTNRQIAAKRGWTIKTVRARLSLLGLPSRKEPKVAKETGPVIGVHEG